MPERIANEIERVANGDPVLAGRLANDPAFAAVAGNSPFLADCIAAQPDFFVTLLDEGPDVAFVRAKAAADAGPAADIVAHMAALRAFKRRAALTIAMADIAGTWSLERVTGALSEVAEIALNQAADHALRAAAARGAITLGDPGRPGPGSGLVIIAMGKLGARELNYSSDIDIIVLYDPARARIADGQGIGQVFIRITREIVKILSERGPDGYVFRTDLRLRPDPGSTPLALSTEAAEVYYESFGQNWERAAMIKARAIAGDIVAGETFIASLRPFIWRKSLDFAAIQDIHSIKRQIDVHRGGGRISLLGHDVKIGRGGIREIEFFAQTQQLIWGGRFPGLRQRETLKALAALAEHGRFAPAVFDDLAAAYAFLRRIEHRIQMINDEQTHKMPADEAGLARLAIFLGYPDAAAFAADFTAMLQRVERHYAHLFEDSPSLAGPGNLVFTGTDDDPGTLVTLQKMGFRHAAKVSQAIRGWHHGRVRAMRSARARELLTELTPTLLAALGRTPYPDLAFNNFDNFHARLPAGVPIFSLFHVNPALVDLVAEIMGAAPTLADQLGQRPQLLDAVLSPGFSDPPPDLPELQRDLAQSLKQARDFQDALDVLRRWKNERQFQIGVQLLRARISVEQAGRALAHVAEATLAALQPAVEADFARAHGRVPGGGLALMALGKLGGGEMTFTSDLDLVAIYGVRDGIENSDGDKPLPVPLYYARLTSRFANAVTAPTGEGVLYELDLRLRPSGAKGPLAVEIAGFEDYQCGQAWTWEHMALTRARVLSGPAEIKQRIEALKREIITRPRDPVKLATEIADMRALMARENPPAGALDIKRMPGGLIDVEFIAQYLQLRHGGDQPALLSSNTQTVLEVARDVGVLGAEDGDALIAALHLWQTIQGLTRLVGEPGDSERLQVLLAKAAGAVDFASLTHNIQASAVRARAIFERLLPVRS